MKRGSAAMSHVPARIVRRPVEVAAPTRAPAAVELRRLRPSDLGEFVRVVRLSRGDLEPWLPLHRPGESDEALFERQLGAAAAGEATLTACRRIAVARGPDGGERIVGGFNVIAISRGLELSGDLNWWVASDARGVGIGRRGLGHLIEFALADLPRGLGLHVVRAHIQRDNGPSIRLAESVGMRRAAAGCSYIQTGERWALHDLYVRDAW